jgi:hypothetical protein
VQNYLDVLGWSGKMLKLNTDEDYLMVVNNNLGGGKSSSEIKENIIQNINLGNNEIVKEVVITREHTSDYRFKYYDPWAKQDRWLVGRNNNYTKIYVPQGSELIESNGTEEDVEILTENDRTVFGFSLSLDPLEKRSVSIKYKLPISTKDGYRLTIQKQPGSIPSYLETNFTNLKNLDVQTNLERNNNQYTGYLSMDKFIYLQ